ncbi:MAG TPA: fibronectin type III domain-containing protein [Anaeromyxobacter sp.]|nr:fibronectin type III domain-containing protein [Anaeromyxobacter sp.]
MRTPKLSVQVVIGTVLLLACGGGQVGQNPDAETVGTPTFAPAAGAVAAGTVVTISSSTPGASIYTGQTDPPTTLSFSFTVTSAGTWYAQAKLSGWAPSSVARADYTISSVPPSAPTNLVATAASSSTINLTWTSNSTNETGFYVERAPDSGGRAGTFVLVGSVGAGETTYPDTGLTASTIYWYRVRAFNASGDSAYTNTASATTSAASGSLLAFTTTACPAAKQGQAYSCTLAASGGATPYTFSVVNSSSYAPLPEGMSLDPSTGLISSSLVGGQGSYVVQFQVADAASHTANTALTFGIAGANGFLASIFPSNSIFHHRVDFASTGLPVDTSPAAPIYSGYQSATIQAFFGGAAYANLPNGIPAIEVPYNQPDIPVATTVYQSYFTSGPIPPYAPVEGTSVSGGDMHVLVYREGGGGNPPALYEMWQGILLGTNGWTDSSNALWADVTSNALTPQGNGTADAAGLPVAPLLVNADEVIGTGTLSAPNGTVQHPIRFTVNHMLNNWVWPATETAGTGSCTGVPTQTMLSQSSPPSSCSMSGPAGETYRLKASVATPACAATSPQAAIIITAFRNYGIILADNGKSGGLIGTPDSRWNDSDLSCLRSLTLADFEPVNVSSLMVSSDSGAAAH